MITDDLIELLRAAVRAARDAGEMTLTEETFPVTLETPRNKQHGDYSSNLALTLKKATGLNDSRAIAASIVRHLPEDHSLIERVEIAGPGFINFYLTPDWLHAMLVKIEHEDASYGKTNDRADERVLIEFVSANPVGPISVVNGRAAVLGDVLGHLLAAQGCQVGREYYINDALNSLQLEKFAESVTIRYLQQLGHPVLMPASGEGEEDMIEPGTDYPGLEGERPLIPFPKDGYRGEYVKDIARVILAEVGPVYAQTSAEERVGFFRRATLDRMIAAQRDALEAFGIVYDTWFFESRLYDDGEVDQTIERLREHGYVYEKDGALWLRSSALGDDKDRVLVRSNEKATYIAADAAYHDNKFRRGYTRLINIWGADHHGYVGRLKAAVAALGYDPDHLEIVLTQMVSLVREGEVVLGGKRKGNVIELKEDLIDEIGRDAARFYFLLNSYETPATVDVELAKKQSNENPVYYVQYAHARLSSILRRAEEQGIEGRGNREQGTGKREEKGRGELSLLTHPTELDVLRKLADYPAEVAAAARDYAPHRLTRYAIDLAGLLNIFYENCRVLPGQEDPVAEELTSARLALVKGARIVLRNLLGLLGITAPEKM
ncbi:MAG TPA: arginine--tRNA ligase [Chthonomonadaceae bacterium]|nr:arginine--tRNA ligase [Chthonomonadaceae bacterium]